MKKAELENIAKKDFFDKMPDLKEIFINDSLQAFYKEEVAKKYTIGKYYKFTPKKDK